MAAVIMIFPKHKKKADDFYETIDPYFESQDMIIISDNPKIYFTGNSITPVRLKNLIDTIKNSKGYSAAIGDILYTNNLMKTS